jgi:AraC-like DNA-binding protein
MDHQITKSLCDLRTFRFSTDAFPERDRVTEWREFLERQIVKIDSSALAENHHLDAIGMALPGLGVAAMNLGPTRCARTRETMRDGNDNIRLVMLKQSASSAPAAHLGRDLTVEPGSAIVLSNCDFNEITFTAPRSRMLALNFSRKALRPLLRDFDDILAHTIPNQVGALRLLANYSEALLGEPALPTHELQQLAIAHIYDLAALAMGATRDAAEIASSRGLAAARLREIKSDIAANLSRGEISVAEIAQRQRVTPRYIQMLFENEGTTFTEFARNARLNRAYRMLRDPRFADRSISTIAFDAGFTDLSYFNRLFRRRFGGTPSDIRAASKLQA